MGAANHLLVLVLNQVPVLRVKFLQHRGPQPFECLLQLHQQAEHATECPVRCNTAQPC